MALMQMDEQQALEKTEKIRQAILGSDQFKDIYSENKFGVSIGLVELDVNLSLEDNLKRADTALYAAKDAGKNVTKVYKVNEASPTRASSPASTKCPSSDA